MNFLAEEESWGDKESTESAESFSLGSSLLEGDLEGRRLAKSLGTPSIPSPELLDKPIS